MGESPWRACGGGGTSSAAPTPTGFMITAIFLKEVELAAPRVLSSRLRGRVGVGALRVETVPSGENSPTRIASHDATCPASGRGGHRARRYARAWR
jgi:hypothetical protein